jgi:predicted ribosome quality control (RQC) complex YloA/Tae2 family protein
VASKNIQEIKMKIRIDTTKSIEENANYYYEKSKKARKKLEGLKKAIEITKKKIGTLEEKKEKQVKRQQFKHSPELKKYMKYRWFVSSDGFLCIGGRDATTNEVVIKKHTDFKDLVFHTDLPGSPFFVIKSEGKDIPQQTKEEAAIATASFSRAWKEEIGTTEVYCISPEQVRKEFGLPKGSFIIQGKREYFNPIVQLFVNKNKENYLECTPVKGEFELKFGGKISDCAKEIQRLCLKKFEIKYELEDIIRILPGDCSLVKK